jgi:hypothetical protein
MKEEGFVSLTDAGDKERVKGEPKRSISSKRVSFIVVCTISGSVV